MNWIKSDIGIVLFFSVFFILVEQFMGFERAVILGITIITGITFANLLQNKEEQS